jgi:hypothetical protein
MHRLRTHEYGHHLDFAWPVSGLPEPNGTPVWWAARGMAQFLRDGLVAFDYSLGWSRSVGEIFAEDYGPARCDARIVSTTGARLDYTLRLRLAIEA